MTRPRAGSEVSSSPYPTERVHWRPTSVPTPMWIARVPYNVAGGKAMQLLLPRLPNSSARAVPGTIAPVLSIQSRPAWMARLSRRLVSGTGGGYPGVRP